MFPSIIRKNKQNVMLTLSRYYAQARTPYPPASKKIQLDNIKHNYKINKKIPADYRFKYADFLPSPMLTLRNTTCEKLMRRDMLERRKHIHIPEFYVGSIIAVTISDPHSQGKTNRFVGICISRDHTMLFSKIRVRNVIDNQGIEIEYDIYDPAVQKIEVLKLEKRLDSRLIYLKDALPEYSTVDLNMEPEIHAEGSSVRVNETIVNMKPMPWFQKWERQDNEGIEDLDKYLNLWRKQQRIKHRTPWEKYDLMKEYRKTITEEEQSKIFTEIFERINEITEDHKAKAKLKRTISKPSNIG